MQTTETYKPEWISEADVAKWLGVTKNTLFKWRTSRGLAWTNLGSKTPMYDKKQIQEILNENSTYKIEGKKLTA